MSLPNFVFRLFNWFKYLIIGLLALPIISCSGDTSTQNSDLTGSNLKLLKYNNPGLTVNLATGLYSWPLPMDYDKDGDPDLIVSSPDQPYDGTYFFENTSGNKKPVFEPAEKIGKGYNNIQVSYVDGKPRILDQGIEFSEFRKNQFSQPQAIYPNPDFFPDSIRSRAEQWKYVDYEGDGDLDLVVGLGDWADYGWDDAFNKKGEWQNGPLHGYIYLFENEGTENNLNYNDPKRILADGNPIDVYGRPSPNFADFDGDGDLDIICGEFLDKLTWFENTGTRNNPSYTSGRYLQYDNEPIAMDLQMIVPAAYDWDRDGDQDLIVGQEGGKVALVENTGKTEDGMPVFLPPSYFKQKADNLKIGSLVTPVGVDWENDGDEDIVTGTSAGQIVFFENLDGGNPPKWDKPKFLKADGETIRITAGQNGSIQGPAEAKWGYTTLSVKDWDHDGLKDLIVNSILGKIIWYKNTGSADNPKLNSSRPIKVDWNGEAPKPTWNWWNPNDNNLVTQWRTTPVVKDLNNDNLNDLIMLDHEGYLAYFERVSEGDSLRLLPGKRIFSTYYDSGKFRLNDEKAGGSGRRKIALTDWDQDGKTDLLVNSSNIDFYKKINSSQQEETTYLDYGKVDKYILAGHTTSPATVDWDNNNIPDLVIGAEDGHFYYLENPRAN